MLDRCSPAVTDLFTQAGEDIEMEMYMDEGQRLYMFVVMFVSML
jgi:hypothetical protein